MSSIDSKKKGIKSVELFRNKILLKIKMFTNTKPNVTEEDYQSAIYYLNFEEYLKPRSVIKPTKPILLYNDVKPKRQLNLKLLEQPMLITERKPFRLHGKEKLNKIFDCHAVEKRSLNFKPKKKVEQLATIWYNRTVNKPTWIGWGHIQLPRFLRFLRARNDDGLCKRKSGFEIYCEMASIHGFINFVDATTWQRAFWFSVVILAVLLSGFILLLSHFMNTDTPIILYAESTQYPTWSIPFPAVTICNLNRISKHKALNYAEKL